MVDPVAFASEYAAVKAEDCERCAAKNSEQKKGADNKIQASVRLSKLWKKVAAFS